MGAHARPLVLSSILLAVALVLVSISSPNARATTTTFSTTADFDGGTKPLHLSGSWSTKTPMTNAAADSCGAVLSGKLYVIGGYTASPSATTGKTQQYDPALDSWTQKGNLKTPRLGEACIAYNGKIYAFGGVDSASANIAKNEIYDPGTDSWANLSTAMPAGAQGAGGAAFVYGSSIYYVRGSAAYQYNPGSDTWGAKASSALSIRFATYALYADRIVAIGGLDEGTSLSTAAVRTYNITTNSWDDSYDTAPIPLLGGLRENPILNGTIYLVDGYDLGYQFYNLVWAYNPVAKTWEGMSSAIQPRDGIAGGFINGTLYVGSGRQKASSPVGLAYLEAFNPNSGTDAHSIETVTDNPSMSANSFQLGNSMADSFDTIYSPANSYKWAVVPQYYSSSAAPNLNAQYSVASGSLDMLMPAGMSTSETSAFLRTPISGNLNVTYTLERVTSSNFAFFGLLNRMNQYSNTASGTAQNGVMYLWLGTTGHLKAYTVANGSLTLQSDIAGPGANPVFFRVTRTGAVFDFWYSTDGVSYTLQKSVTIWEPADLFPMFSVEETGSAAQEWRVRAFQIHVGPLVGTDTVQESYWLSPGRSSTTDTAWNVTVEYSGATSGRYISAMSLINGTGVRVHTDNTHLTSGTNHTYTIAHLVVSGNWKVELNLTGDGMGSAVVSSIEVDTEPNAASGGGLLSGMNLVVIELILFILAFVVLTTLGFAYHPGFLLLDGILMLYFAFWTYTIIADTVIASVFAAIGVGFILFGFFAHPMGRSSR